MQDFRVPVVRLGYKPILPRLLALPGPQKYVKEQKIAKKAIILQSLGVQVGAVGGRFGTIRA